MLLEKPAVLEYKKVAFEVKAFGDDTEDDNFFTFEGYASTFGNVDLGDDVVDKGAFLDSIANPDIKTVILWQHSGGEPIGMPLVLREDEKGLYIKARLPKEDTLVSGRVIPQMRVGSIASMSIGFATVDFSLDGGIRHLKKLNLWEVSLVTFPMNTHAAVTGMKSATTFKDLPLADRDKPWSASEARARVAEFTGSEEEPSAKYKNAFLWYDKENADEFSAYKLPFADVVDGALVAVPRGTFAAAAAMQGARGGVDIPDADRPAVERHINRYYDKMDLESPFEKGGLGVIELETMSAKEIEKYLRDSGIFSRKASTIITSHFIKGQSDSVEGVQSDSGESGNPLLSELRKLHEVVTTSTGEKHVRERESGSGT